MLKKITKHLSHFLPLLGILFATFIGCLIFWYDKTFQAIIISASSVCYVVWGLVHHKLHGEIHYSVILEYVSIGLLGLVVGLSLIFTA